MSIKRHFFLAYMVATMQGNAVYQFNSVSAKNNKPVSGQDLSQFQQAAAEQLQAEQVNFDNIIIQNIVYLGEFTDEEFFGNSAVTEEGVQAAVEESLKNENENQPETDGMGHNLDGTAPEAETIN